MERTDGHIDDLLLLVEKGTDDEIRDFLNILHPADVADMLEAIDDPGRKRVLSLLDLTAASEVLSEIESHYRRELISDIVRDRLVDIIEKMESDDAADLLGEMPHEDAQRILSDMDVEEGEEISRLLRYPDDSAGGIMQAELVAIPQTATVSEAIEAIRENREEVHDLHNVFVVNDEQQLLGLVPLRILILADPGEQISNVMDVNVISANALMDQEEVAGIFRKYDFVSLPVVDSRKRLLGRIVVDDIVDVLDEEADEDFMKLSGSMEEELIGLSLGRSVSSRLPWLFVTFIAGAITAFVISWYNDSYKHLILFIPFLPLIIGMAGNVGNQSATIIVRGLATGRVDASKVWQVAAKEIWVGLVIGLIYGVLLGLVAGYLKVDELEGLKVGLAVGLSLSLVVTMAAILGVMLPIMFHRMKVDPALATAPFISSSMDLLGAAVYLSIAMVLFS